MKCMKWTTMLAIVMMLAGVCRAGSLSFSRPGVVFLPTQAQVDAMQDGSAVPRWRDSDISVVLRFESSRYGQQARSVRFALVREGQTVKLGIVGPNQDLSDSASVAPDTHVSLTLVVPTAQLLAWRTSIPTDGFENWSLQLTYDGASRGVTVGSVRVVHIKDGDIR